MVKKKRRSFFGYDKEVCAFCGATFMLFTLEGAKKVKGKKGRRCLISKIIGLRHVSIKHLVLLSLTTKFVSFLIPYFLGLMICRNARHLSETMVFNKHRIKSLSDPSVYIQYFNALEYLDVVVEIQFS